MNIERLKKICYESDFIRSPYIYKIIESGILDKQIKKIKYQEVQTSMYQTFENGKTDTYLLFLINLDKFLMFLEINFIININEKTVLLKNVFNTDRANVFISKKDINKERDWYILEYKKLIVEPFFNTLTQLLKNNKNIKKQLNKIIDIKKLSVDKDAEKLFDILKKLINCSRENIHLLFTNYEKLVANEIFLEDYLEIFDNFKDREKYLKHLGF